MPNMVGLNEQGEIDIDEKCHTSVPGIFAAGDATCVRARQIIVAAGEEAKERVVATGL